MIIWPQYIDKNLSLSEGRKIPLEYCVKDVNVNDIGRALKRLRIPHEIKKDKSYPRYWYDKSGMVIAESEMNKNELLKEIGIKINETKK